jgi:non-ribosomal peptide synthetase component F
MRKQQKASGAESVPAHRNEAGERAEQSVPQRVADHARAAPHAIALRAGAGRTMSYGELDARADAVAGYLRSIGVGREAVVGIALERSFERIVACLAVWRAGGAFLPLDPSLPEAQLRGLLDDAQALAVIGPASTVSRLASVSRLPVALGATGNALAQFAMRAVRETNHPDDLAYVIYTSGSTGEPKGVEITHGNLANLVNWHHAAFDVTAADTASHVAGLGFDAAIWEVWSCLGAGATLTIADDATRSSAVRLKQWLCDEQVSIGFVPTPLAELLIAMEWPAAPKLRFLLTGGDTLHIFPRAELPFAVVNNYGPAECTIVATSGVMPTARCPRSASRSRTRRSIFSIPTVHRFRRAGRASCASAAAASAAVIGIGTKPPPRASAPIHSAMGPARGSIAPAISRACSRMARSAFAAVSTIK